MKPPQDAQELLGSSQQQQQQPKQNQAGAFVHKLYSMLEDPSIKHLISWSNSNESFVMWPGKEFSKVLSQYFKHTNVSSFVRQLNMYGFHKVNDVFHSNPAAESGRWEFRHGSGSFRRGDLQSLRAIKRRSSRQSTHTLFSRDVTASAGQSPDSSSSAQNEQSSRSQDSSTHSGNQTSISTDIHSQGQNTLPCSTFAHHQDGSSAAPPSLPPLVTSSGGQSGLAPNTTLPKQEPVIPSGRPGEHSLPANYTYGVNSPKHTLPHSLYLPASQTPAAATPISPLPLGLQASHLNETSQKTNASNPLSNTSLPSGGINHPQDKTINMRIPTGAAGGTGYPIDYRLLAIEQSLWYHQDLICNQKVRQEQLMTAYCTLYKTTKDLADFIAQDPREDEGRNAQLHSILSQLTAHDPSVIFQDPRSMNPPAMTGGSLSSEYESESDRQESRRESLESGASHRRSPNLPSTSHVFSGSQLPSGWPLNSSYRRPLSNGSALPGNVAGYPHVGFAGPVAAAKEVERMERPKSFPTMSPGHIDTSSRRHTSIELLQAKEGQRMKEGSHLKRSEEQSGSEIPARLRNNSVPAKRPRLDSSASYPTVVEQSGSSRASYPLDVNASQRYTASGRESISQDQPSTMYRPPLRTSTSAQSQFSYQMSADPDLNRLKFGYNFTNRASVDATNDSKIDDHGRHRSIAIPPPTSADVFHGVSESTKSAVSGLNRIEENEDEGTSRETAGHERSGEKERESSLTENAEPANSKLGTAPSSRKCTPMGGSLNNLLNPVESHSPPTNRSPFSVKSESPNISTSSSPLVPNSKISAS